MGGDQTRPKLVSEEGRAFREALKDVRASFSQSRAIFTFVQSFPGLAWIKRYNERDQKYYMVALSEKYVRDILGGAIEDYLGRTDFDVWDYETAYLFFQNDEATRLGTRDPAERVHEPWTSSRTGKSGHPYFRKWRFQFEGHIYVAGMEA